MSLSFPLYSISSISRVRVLDLGFLDSPIQSRCKLELIDLCSKQERLEFLYDSGLAVGRPGGSDSLKEAFTKAEEPSSSAAAAAKVFIFIVFVRSDCMLFGGVKLDESARF